MTAQDFFFTVAEMRAAQKAYIETRNQNTLRLAIKLEGKVDAEIERVRQILRSELH